MVIYDSVSKKRLEGVTLYLTPAEASELADSLRALAEHPEQHHAHIPAEDGDGELTVAVYTADNLTQFGDESRQLLWEKLRG